jgi:hypothetical protein
MLGLWETHLHVHFKNINIIEFSVFCLTYAIDVKVTLFAGLTR